VDQGSLVEEQIGDGRRFVERFAADGNPVSAAFWIKTAEEGIWFLYVATDMFDRHGPAAAYRAVHSSLQKLGKSSVSSSEIKVISANNPMARDVLALMTRAPERLATRRGSRTLGLVAVEEIYIYPPHVFAFTQANPMTSNDVMREITQIMNRGNFQPSRVTLKDGTAFNGVPFSMEMRPQRMIEVRFIAEGELTPRVLPLDQIASIG